MTLVTVRAASLIPLDLFHQEGKQLFETSEANSLADVWIFQ